MRTAEPGEGTSPEVLVQFGAGHDAPHDWANFDASPVLRLQSLPVIGRLLVTSKHRFPPNVQFGDVVRGLPVAPGSVSHLYASHVIEHLSLADARLAFARAFNLLGRGGVFRLVVPDLEVRARRYIDDLETGKSNAAPAFVQSLGMGVQVRQTVRQRIRDGFGNSRHRWMWDESSLRDELTRAGFQSIRRCSLGDSQSRVFDAIERSDRYVSRDGLVELAVEAKREW
jgi:hypothetical protein